MSKSAILSSSIAKKYWMALTGLFLCLFLVGHLLGNLQLIFITGEEGKRAFNEYAYFMTHNPLIKVMSYLTYLSILFHAIDGFLLTIQNKKARPVPYAYNKPAANSSTSSRYMALLGSLILIFIVTHMANFWWKMKYSSDPMPLHTYVMYPPYSQSAEGDTVYYTVSRTPIPKDETVMIKDGNKLYPNIDAFQNKIAEAKKMSQLQGQQFDDAKFKNMEKNEVLGEGYKDLHSVVLAFFGHDKSKDGVPANEMALFAVILYVVGMLVLAFHLWHGFSSAFQSLGVNHKRYNRMIANAGKFFAVVI
ncbi:MAG: succinate dehydrogenase cytochrome b subunit, partial [Crocinitomicaceae bacterium]|nr:succinate dehydrogenase cytochrome b subunit [Crocinitomicaceae bacterium]